ncbi:MAG TPA: DUF84 family protein, partial [Acidilobales archaeon]|nr:DUF84 family protein [Acidilobales archaeon]
PPQPMGLNEIFEGAYNRAVNALNRDSECSLGVGVEAGIYEVKGRYFDVQVAAIVDRNGFTSYGLSPSFQIPKPFSYALTKGEAKELEEVVDRYFGTKDIGAKGGLIKILTKSVVLREELTYYAVVMALIPRLNPNLYEIKM